MVKRNETLSVNKKRIILYGLKMDGYSAPSNIITVSIHTATSFGRLPDGREVKSYTLRNGKGASLTVIDYGAIITSLKIPAGNQTPDVVLGFDTAADYIAARALPAPPYFGAVIGRWAGRIKAGAFSIGIKQYRLNKNNGNNTLHGGIHGFDNVLWDVISVADQPHASITFQHISPAGEENFPGQLTVRVTYTLTDANGVQLTYVAETTEDTIVNLTQHSYFNLDGHAGSVEEQLLQVNADQLLEIDAANIPSGKIIHPAEKGFDFSSERKCPDFIDDSFVLQDHSLPAATLRSKKTGLMLSVFTDQPSVHIYLGGDCFGRISGKDATAYHAHSGICFETQNFPDAPNHKHFPNAVLRKGETYRQNTTWKFTGDET